MRRAVDCVERQHELVAIHSHFPKQQADGDFLEWRRD